MILAVSDIVKHLGFPLILLVIGALLTSWLIPRFTRRRDDHRRALEVKTQLVRDVSVAVTEFVTAIRFAALATTEPPRVTQTSGVFEDAYKTWEKRRAAVGTELEAYFPTTNIEADWREFRDCMTVFYEIIRDKDTRADRANDLLKRADTFLETCCREGRQQDRNNRDKGMVEPVRPGETLEQIEETLERRILDCKGVLIRSVMDWRVEGLEGPPPMRERVLTSGRAWLGRRRRASTAR